MSPFFLRTPQLEACEVIFFSKVREKNFKREKHIVRSEGKISFPDFFLDRRSSDSGRLKQLIQKKLKCAKIYNSAEQN